MLVSLIQSLAFGLTKGTLALLLLLCPDVTRLNLKLPENGKSNAVGKVIDIVCGQRPTTDSSTHGPPLLRDRDCARDFAIAREVSDASLPLRRPQEISTFSHLRDLTLNCGVRWDRIDGPSSSSVKLRSVLPLLRLPSLRTFTGYGVIDMHKPDAKIEPIGKLAIRHLNLRRCFLGSESIVELLNTCSGLETVELRWENGPMAERQDGVFATPIDLYRATSWTDIRNALQAHRDTLVHLAVEDHRVANSGVPWAPSFSIQFPSKSKGTCHPVELWQNLPALRHLQLSIRALDRDRPCDWMLLISAIPKTVCTLVLKARKRDIPSAELEEVRMSQVKAIMVHDSFTSLRSTVLKNYLPLGDHDLKDYLPLDEHDLKGTGWMSTDQGRGVLLDRKGSATGVNGL